MAVLSRPRRITPRRACNRFRPMHVLQDGIAVPGWTTVRDVSRQGIGLLGLTAFEPGAVLTVQLPRGCGVAATTLRARVRHVRALPGGRWITGCRLTRPLDPWEMQRLL